MFSGLRNTLLVSWKTGRNPTCRRLSCRQGSSWRWRRDNSLTQTVISIGQIEVTKLATMPSEKENRRMKSILIGLGALALLVAQPIQARSIDKNKAFNLCKSEVKSEYVGASRYRLRGIKDRGAGYQVKFVLYYPGSTQKVLCELNRHSGMKKLTEL